MPDEPETHHPLIHWVYARWPKWVKWCAIAAGLFGWLGTFMGWGGNISQAIHGHDVRVQAAAIAAQLDRQRDDRVDRTLEEHGKAIEQTKVGVNAIQSTLAKQDVELLDRKDQLTDRDRDYDGCGQTASVALAGVLYANEAKRFLTSD